jgi:hypothetical protein
MEVLAGRASLSMVSRLRTILQQKKEHGAYLGEDIISREGAMPITISSEILAGLELRIVSLMSQSGVESCDVMA